MAQPPVLGDSWAQLLMLGWGATHTDTVLRHPQRHSNPRHHPATSPHAGLHHARTTMPQLHSHTRHLVEACFGLLLSLAVVSRPLDHGAAQHD
jgi:hypothetical protein